MTRSMSAACATSSVIAVDGVSGEMATPAFIFRSWMDFIRERGSARGSRRFSRIDSWKRKWIAITRRFDVETIQCAAGVGDVVYPL